MVKCCPPASLMNWPVFGLKVGLATALAFMLDNAFHLNDAVSAGFVAVVCTSPTMLSGMKRGTEQLAGSLLGGGIATILLLAGLRGSLAIGLSVGISATLSGLFRMQQAHIVAAFAALYVMILGAANPAVSCWKHFLAVAIGGASATLVNILVSALLYPMLFTRRMDILRKQLAWTFEAAERGEDTFDAAFAMIGDLGCELDDASGEPLARRKRVKGMILRYQEEVALLKELAHYGKDAFLRSDTDTFKATLETLKGKGAPAGTSPLALATRRWSEQCRPEK